MGPESETGSRSPGGSYLEVEGVCLSVRLGTCTRACRRARIAAPLIAEFVQKSAGLFQKTVIDTCAVKPMLVAAAAEDRD